MDAKPAWGAVPRVTVGCEGKRGGVCWSESPAQTPRGTFPNLWLSGLGGPVGRLPGSPWAGLNPPPTCEI